MKFHISNDYFFMDLDLITNNSRIVGEENGQLITTSEREEKDVKKVSLICDRCGQPFKYNVLFDKNGDSVNTIKTPLLCSKCIVEVKK